MSTSIDECRAYPCPSCGADVNPMTDVCRECGWVSDAADLTPYEEATNE